MRLQIIEETILKQRPLPWAQLTPYERYSGYSGTEFLIDQYIPQDSCHGHVKVILHHPVNQRRAWYAYESHVKLLDREKAIDLLIAKGTGIYLKQSILPAKQLSEDNCFFLEAGHGVLLTDYSTAERQHWKIKLKKPINGKITWYVQQHAVELSLVPEVERRRLLHEPLVNLVEYFGTPIKQTRNEVENIYYFSTIGLKQAFPQFRWPDYSSDLDEEFQIHFVDGLSQKIRIAPPIEHLEELFLYLFQYPAPEFTLVGQGSITGAGWKTWRLGNGIGMRKELYGNNSFNNLQIFYDPQYETSLLDAV